MTPIPPPDRWLVRPQPKPHARLRLFCFPYAGSGASSFRGWAQQLPVDVELCIVQLPGRENRLRDQLFTEMDRLLPALEEALTLHLSTPFACFGYSLGSLISFEWVRYLRRQGHPLPLHLLVGGRRAPHLPASHPPISHLPEAEFVAGLRRFEGIPEMVLQSEELMQLFLPTLRADFRIHEEYLHTDEPPLPCPIAVFGGLADGETTPESLDAWRLHTMGEFSVQMFPGGHFFLHPEQSALLLAVNRLLAPHLAHLPGAPPPAASAPA